MGIIDCCQQIRREKHRRTTFGTRPQQQRRIETLGLQSVQSDQAQGVQSELVQQRHRTVEIGHRGRGIRSSHRYTSGLLAGRR